MSQVIAIVVAGLALSLVGGIASAHTSLDYPNGGEVFTPGEVVTIRWHIWIYHPTESWELWYTLDNGTTIECSDQPEFDWMPLALDIPVTCLEESGTCEPGGDCQMEYEWTIPEGIDSDSVKVRVRMNGLFRAYYDVSDGPFTIRSPVAAPDDLPGLGFDLEQNSPNPFTQETRIGFTLAAFTGRVRLQVHDAAGRIVRTLVDGPLNAGHHSIVWDGTTDRGARAASGTYFYALGVGNRRSTSRLALID